MSRPSSVNQEVAGSSPARGANYFNHLCFDRILTGRPGANYSATRLQWLSPVQPARDGSQGTQWLCADEAVRDGHTAEPWGDSSSHRVP
jgi:hypothetical protein